MKSTMTLLTSTWVGIHKCPGIYPVGSIVDMSGGETGIVVVPNLIRRLKPKVMLVGDKNKTLLMPPRIVDPALLGSAGQGGGYTIIHVLIPAESRICAIIWA